jgi:hypothetical protein
LYNYYLLTSFIDDIQAVYDTCVKENLGMDRPHWGYHSLPKIHETDRPKPIEEKPAWMDNPKVMHGMSGWTQTPRHFNMR